MFGYARDGVTIVEPEAAALREAASTLLSGGTMREITRRLNEQGLRTTAAEDHVHDERRQQWVSGRLDVGVERGVRRTAQVRALLANPRLAGLRRYRGETRPGCWEPILTPGGASRRPTRCPGVSPHRGACARRR